MKIFTPILFLSLLLSTSGYTQTIEADTIKARKLLMDLPESKKEAFQQLEQVVAIYEQYKLTELLYEAKLELEDNRNYDSFEEAIENRIGLLNEVEEVFSSPHKNIARAHQLLGIVYIETGAASKGINHLKSADSILLAVEPRPLLMHFKVLNDLMRAYHKIGDQKRGNGYFNLMEELSEKIKSTNLPKIILLSNKIILNISSPRALKWTDELFDLGIKEYGRMHPNMFNIMRYKAHYYYANKESAKAVKVLKEIADLEKEYYGKENLALARTYQDIGTFYKDWVVPENASHKEWIKERAQYQDIAIEYMLKAAEIYEKETNGLGANACILYRNLGYSYFYAKTDWEKSIEAFHKSLLAVLPNEKERDPLAIIRIDPNKTICLNWELAFRAYDGKFNILDFMSRKGVDSLPVADLMVKTLTEMERITDIYAQNLADDAQQTTFDLRIINFRAATKFQEMQKRGEFDSDYLSRLHQNMESSKNSILLANLQTNEASKTGLLNDELLEQEVELKKRITKSKKRLMDVLGGQKAEEEIRAQKKDLLKAQVAYEDFIQRIKKEDPKYYDLKYKQEIPQLSEIQELLDEQTIILEYFIHYQALFILQIASDTAIFREIRLSDRRKDDEEMSKTALFEKHFQGLRESLVDVKRIKSDSDGLFKDFCRTSYGLYKMLELDSFLLEDQGIKHLIIIPSEKLNYVPFEVLLRKEVKDTTPSYKDLPYLFKDFSISYAYSTSLLYQNMKQKTESNGRMLAFAASYNNDIFENMERSGNLEELRNGLADLPGAKAEVQHLQALYGGKFFFGEEANESRFKKESSQNNYSIIHLAMHGLLNKDYPFASSLAFTEDGDTLEDNFVFAYELSQMEIQAKLVVLSACETGYGKFEYGEGVASIARSFMFAGTSSMLMTLWEVNDYSTSKIMGYFYESLSEGIDKAEALRQAKLKYLEESNGIASHPFFWAPYVQLGNYEAIGLKKKTDLYLFWGLLSGGIAMVVLLGGLFWYRKSKRKAA